MYRSVRFISLALILVAVVSVMAVGQSLVQFKIPVLVTSAAVPGKIDTLVIGVHGDGVNPPGTVLDNTYNPDLIEDGYPVEWSELPNPPDPPTFSSIAKFINIPGRTSMIGTGIKPNDFRGYSAANQVDSFQINLYGDGTDQLVATGSATIAWPAGISSYCDSMKLLVRSGAVYVPVANMELAAGSYTDPNASGGNNLRYLIIKYGAKVPPPGPFCVPNPTSLALGSVSANVTVSTIILTNTGDANDLTISGVTAPAGFATSLSSTSVAKQGGTATLTVTFDATALAAGVYSGNIVIASNAVGGDVSIPVSATVVDAAIAPVAAIAFGVVPYPQVRNQVVALTNLSPLRAVSISSITLPTGFSIAPAITSIAPSATVNVTVTFTTQVSGGVQSGNIAIAGNAPLAIAVSGTSQVQGGKLAFAATAITVLDNSFNGTGDANGGPTTDGYYTATIGLHEYSGAPLKNIQFTIKTNGLVIGYKLIKQPKVAGWNLSSKIMRGAVQPDGSSIDSINVVLWSLGADVLDTTGIATAPLPLLTFGYDVVNINVNSATTSFELTKILGSTSTFVDAQLNTEAAEAITITNRINRGDVNNDDRVDILDLLMIVDHITGKAPLTPGSDSFIAADVAPWPAGDGAVNVMDLAQLQSIILNNAYPDGNPLLGAKVALTQLSKGAAAPVKLQIFNNGKELGLRMINSVPVRGLAVRLSGFNSAVVDAKSDVSGMASGFKAGELSILVKTGVAYQTGINDLGRIPVSCVAARVEVVEGTQVVGNELELVSYEIELKYEKMDDRTAPKAFALSQNYPNPFNPTTKINYDVKELSHVRIAIYNILGQEVATVVNGELEAGRYSYDWNGMDSNGKALSTGTYIYRMTAGNFVETKKMMFVK